MSGKVTCEIANRLYDGIGQNWPQKLRLPSGYLILLELSKGSGLTDSWSKLIQDTHIKPFPSPVLSAIHGDVVITTNPEAS